MANLEVGHRFELRTADEVSVPLVTEYLKPLPATTPLLQPAYGDYLGGIGPWELDFKKLFSIPGPGVYRFRYAYVPPQDREAKEYGEVTRPKFWNGKAYGDYFEFRILEPASD